MGAKRSDARNCNQMILEAVFKVNEIIIDSRFGEQAFAKHIYPSTNDKNPDQNHHQNHHHHPNQLHQRFNLNVPTIPELRKQVSFLQSNLHERFSIHIRHEASNTVLEKWEIGYMLPLDVAGGEEVFTKLKLRQTYLQLMVFLRSCCSLCLLLPLSKLSSSQLLTYEVVQFGANHPDKDLNRLESLLDYKRHEFKLIHALTGSLQISVGYISDYSTLLTHSPSPTLAPFPHPQGERDGMAEKDDSDFVFAHSPPKDESKLADQESTKPKSALTKMLLEHSRLTTTGSAVEGANVSASPPAEEAPLRRSEMPDVFARLTGKDGEGFSAKEVDEPALGSRATSHPRAIPVRRKNQSALYTKTRSTPMRESGRVDAEVSPDDAALMYAFPSNFTRPHSLPIETDLGQLHTSSLSSGIARGLSRSKLLARSVHEAGQKHRPGSLPLPHPLRARAVETFPFKQPRGSSKSFHMYDPGMRQSSSLLSEKSVKMVTLPSGTIYRSPSGSSLADLISRSSLASQQLGTVTNSLDPTTPPFVVFSKGAQEMTSPPLQLSGSASSSPGAFPTTLAMAVHSTANPFIQGPARSHRTLVSTSMPRSTSVNSAASGSNSSSRLSIQPFKERTPRRQARRSLGSTPSLIQQEMTSSASRRKVSLSNVPRSNPWVVPPEDIDKLITHLKDKEGEIGEVYHTEDAEPQADLDLPFAMPNSADDLGPSTMDSDLAFFMRMLKQPPELSSIGVLQRPRRTLPNEAIR